MEQALTPDQAVDAARALVDPRFDSIRALATSQTDVRRLEADLAAAREVNASSFAGALAAGWSEQDLKGIGFTVPGAAPVRPRASGGRSRGPSRPRGGGQPATTTPSGSAPAIVPAGQDTVHSEHHGTPVNA